MAQVEIFIGVIIPSEWAERIEREINEECERIRRIREEEARERELVAWLADEANWEDPNFSDIYKDVYGFRPRYCCGRGYWSY